MATNNLRVVYNPVPENQTKKNFAVCVKGLSFPNVDFSVRFSPHIFVGGEITLFRLVEWVEMVTALGAEKIFIYNLEVHPNITKVQTVHPNITKVQNRG